MSNLQRVYYTGPCATPYAPGLGTQHWVQFTGGAFTVPADDAAITIGGVAKNLLGVYDSNGVLLTTADSMPSTGFIRYRDGITSGSAGAIVSGANTIGNTTDLSAAFELTGSNSSYRGANQLRVNFQTTDGTFTGVTGDYAAGVPTPVSPIKVNIQNPASPTDTDADTRFYTYTYVNQVGFESAPAPVTADPITAGASSIINISVPSKSSIRYHPAIYGKNIVQDYIPVISIRVYRTNTGTSETGFQLIAEVPVQSYGQQMLDVDNDDLGVLMVTDEWDVPPPVVTSCAKMSNFTYVLVHENTVHFSIPGIVYAYPVLYNQTTKDNLLHIEAVGNSAVILSDGGPYLVAGSAPEAMEVIKLPFYQAVQNVRAVSVFLDLVVYPGQDGLIGVDSSGKVTNLTKDIFEESQWRSTFSFADCYSVIYDGTYYFISTDAGNKNSFAFHLPTRAYQPLDSDVLGALGGSTKSAWYDSTNDVLYFSLSAAGNNLMTWNPENGATMHSWSWESKEFYVPDRSFGAIKITGIIDALNTVQARIITDGVDGAQFVVNSEDVIRLPAIRGSKVKVQLTYGIGAPEVHTVQLGVHPTELI